jgi:hypothetical protein
MATGETDPTNEQPEVLRGEVLEFHELPMAMQARIMMDREGTRYFHYDDVRINYRGMGSEEALRESLRFDTEPGEGPVPYHGPAADVLHDIQDRLRGAGIGEVASVYTDLIGNLAHNRYTTVEPPEWGSPGYIADPSDPSIAEQVRSWRMPGLED